MTELQNFFTACFNQDWGTEYSNYEDAVRDFMRRAHQSAVDAVVNDLAELLERPVTPDVLDRLGGNVWAAGLGLTDEQLLRGILAVLRHGWAGRG